MNKHLVIWYVANSHTVTNLKKKNMILRCKYQKWTFFSYCNWFFQNVSCIWTEKLKKCEELFQKIFNFLRWCVRLCICDCTYFFRSFENVDMWINFDYTEYYFRQIIIRAITNLFYIYSHSTHKAPNFWYSILDWVG